MSSEISDVMVEVRMADSVSADMRTAVDIFLDAQGQDSQALGIIVSEDDVTLAVREGGKQYLYIVQTPTEAGSGTQYTIVDAVREILDTADIRVDDNGAFSSERKFASLGVEGVDPGELDACVCANMSELEDSLEDVLDTRVIDWA